MISCIKSHKEEEISISKWKVFLARYVILCARMTAAAVQALVVLMDQENLLEAHASLRALRSQMGHGGARQYALRRHRTRTGCSGVLLEGAFENDIRIAHFESVPQLLLGKVVGGHAEV